MKHYLCTKRSGSSHGFNIGQIPLELHLLINTLGADHIIGTF